MRRWPRWLRRPRADPMPHRHVDSLRHAETCLREVTKQRGRVDELERMLGERRKANRFSAAMRDALGGRPWM